MCLYNHIDVCSNILHVQQYALLRRPVLWNGKLRYTDTSSIQSICTPQFPIYIMTFTVSAAKIIVLDMMSNSRLSLLQSPSHEPIENGCPYWNDYKIADNIKQCKIIRI